MYCPACGTGFDDEDHYCRGCGKKLAAVIAKPRRHGAGMPSDAALRSIGTGVATDIRVKRTQSAWGIASGILIILFSLPAMMLPAVGILLFFSGAITTVYAAWEYGRYDDAYARMRHLDTQSELRVLDDPRRSGPEPERSTGRP